MCKKQALRDMVMERLVAAADDIFALIEQVFAEYEQELLRLKWAKLQDRKEQNKEDVPTPFAHPEANPEHTEVEQTLCNTLQLPLSPLKSEDNIDKASLLHHDQTEDHRQESTREQCAAEEASCNLELQPALNERPQSCSDTDDSVDWGPSVEKHTVNSGKESDGAHNTYTSSRKHRKRRKRQLEQNETGVSIKREREEQLESCIQSGPISGTSEKPFSYSVYEGSLEQNDHLKSKAAQAKHKPAICPECGVKLNRGYSLERHISAVHRGERPYNCPVCERAFAQKTDCVIHMSTHTGAKPYICPVCQRSFGIKKSLQRHMKLHSSR